MSVITISRGSFSHGKEIAEKVAQELGYECIAREVLLDASKEFNIPELKLFNALYDPPSILDRIIHGQKERYITYIQAAVLRNLKKDNVVYHGFAGHFFVKDVPHVLKVRIIAALEDRMKALMEKESISTKDDALHSINTIDDHRKKWSQRLYGIDTWDPFLYDLVIHINKLKVDDAVDIICKNVRLEQFQTTPESQQQIDDLYLAVEVKASLIGLKPDVEVSAQNGFVCVNTKAPVAAEPKLIEDMRKIVLGIPGVKDIEISVIPYTPYASD